MVQKFEQRKILLFPISKKRKLPLREELSEAMRAWPPTSSEPHPRGEAAIFRRRKLTAVLTKRKLKQVSIGMVGSGY